MDKLIKSILCKIESEGYEAYIVGGFVRDKLLNKPSYDVDICTNALPKDLHRIFPGNTPNNYGGFNLKYKKFNIDITTYRNEINYEKNRLVQVEYINNLFDDIKRRDFTINSLCMDKNENIIDLLNARDDLKNKIIKVIGNPHDKFTQDPLRMMRAIRFATILNFQIDRQTLQEIKNNSHLVSSLSNEKIKYELSKILSDSNFAYGINILNETKISDAIGLKTGKIVYTSDIIGMWAQIECPKINYSKNEKDYVMQIRQILNTKRVDNHNLFTHGLYLSLVAGEIMGISHETINKAYHNLPIFSMKDIDISGNDIINTLQIQPSKLISDIMHDVKNQILNGNLKNKKSEIKKYIESKWHNE